MSKRKIHTFKETGRTDIPSVNDIIMNCEGMPQRVKPGEGWTASKILTYSVEEIKWKPKEGEQYWFITSEGYLMLRRWSNDPLDESRYKLGNCFQTKQEAEKYREIQELIFSCSVAKLEKIKEVLK